MAHWTISDSELTHQIADAESAGAAAVQHEPRAKAARYLAASRQLIVELSNGCAFMLPVDQVPALTGAADQDLVEIEILGKGAGLHWEKLNADLSIASLMLDILGCQTGLRELARRGGSVSTPAKAAAARINGAKGGRPKKHPLPVISS